MCFLRLLSVLMVSLGVFSSVSATDAIQRTDRAPVDQSSQQNHSKQTDQHVIQTHQGQTPKQVMSAHTEDLQALMLALYESHPEELTKSAQISPREMTEWVFDGKFGWRFDSLRSVQDQSALDLLFDERFQGDHVLALVTGLETSLFHGYGAENEFAIPVEQDDLRMQTLACTLRDFQKRYHGLMAGPKSVPILQQAASQQLVSSTLDSILQRMPSRLGSAAIDACRDRN
jgi:hypothetical protein